MSDRIIDLTKKTTPDGTESIPGTEQIDPSETWPKNKRFTLGDIKTWILDGVPVYTIPAKVITLTINPDFGFPIYDSLNDMYILAVIFLGDGTSEVKEGLNVVKEDNADINSVMNYYLPKGTALTAYHHGGINPAIFKILYYTW